MNHFKKTMALQPKNAFRTIAVLISFLQISININASETSQNKKLFYEDYEDKIISEKLLTDEEINKDKSKSKSKKNSIKNKIIPKGTVQWNPPKKKIIDDKNIQITLKGFTSPGSRILLYKMIQISTPDRYNKLWKNKYISKDIKLFLKGKKPVAIDKNGNFNIRLTLPQNRFKIVITFKNIQGKKEKYIAFIHLDKLELLHKVKFIPPEDKNTLEIEKKKIAEVIKKAKKERTIEHGLIIGGGLSYFNYKHSYTTGQAPSGFSSNRYSTIYGKIKMPFGKEWNLNLFLHQSPGGINTTDYTIKGDENFSWDQYGADFNYISEHLDYNLKKMQLKLEPIIGFYYISTPFIYQQIPGQDTFISTSNTSINISGGLNVIINENNNNSFKIFFKYHYLAFDLSDYNLSSSEAMDLGIGYKYNLSKNWQLSFLWTGQYHKYNFSFINEDFSDQQTTGLQYLRASLFEMMIGYQY